jgi:hypothetical protein
MRHIIKREAARRILLKPGVRVQRRSGLGLKNESYEQQVTGRRLNDG